MEVNTFVHEIQILNHFLNDRIDVGLAILLLTYHDDKNTRKYDSFESIFFCTFSWKDTKEHTNAKDKVALMEKKTCLENILFCDIRGLSSYAPFKRRRPRKRYFNTLASPTRIFPLVSLLLSTCQNVLRIPYSRHLLLRKHSFCSHWIMQNTFNVCRIQYRLSRHFVFNGGETLIMLSSLKHLFAVASWMQWVERDGDLIILCWNTAIHAFFMAYHGIWIVTINRMLSRVIWTSMCLQRAQLLNRCFDSILLFWVEHLGRLSAPKEVN